MKCWGIKNKKKIIAKVKKRINQVIIVLWMEKELLI